MRVIRMNIPTIANAVQLGPWHAIVVGRLFDRLPPTERHAIIAHERGHIALKHTTERLKWLVKCRWMVEDFCTITRRQEFEADDYAVDQGHARGLVKHLARFYELEPDPLYPTPRERIARITQRSTSCPTP